jgi:hypothetical protein
MATPSAPRELPRKYRTTEVRVPQANAALLLEDPVAGGLDLLQQSLRSVSDHLIEKDRVRTEEGLFDLDVALKESLVEGLFTEDTFLAKWSVEHPNIPLDGLGTRALSQVSLYAGKSQGYADIRTLKEGMASGALSGSEALGAAREAQLDAYDKAEENGMWKLGVAEESRDEYDSLLNQAWLNDAAKAKTEQRTSATQRAIELGEPFFAEGATPQNLDNFASGMAEMKDSFSQADDPEAEIGLATLSAATTFLSDRDNYALADDYIDLVDEMELIQTPTDTKAWALMKKGFYASREAATQLGDSAADQKLVRSVRHEVAGMAVKNDDGLLSEKDYVKLTKKYPAWAISDGVAGWNTNRARGDGGFSSSNIGKNARTALDESEFTNDPTELNSYLDTKVERKWLQDNEPELYSAMTKQITDIDDERPMRRQRATEDWEARAEENGFFEGPEAQAAWVKNTHEDMQELDEHNNEIYGNFAEKAYLKLEKANEARKADDVVLNRSPARSWETQVHIDKHNEALAEAAQELQEAQQLWDSETDFGESVTSPPDAADWLRDIPILGPSIQALSEIEVVGSDDAEDALKALEKAKDNFLNKAAKVQTFIEKQNRQLEQEKNNKGLTQDQISSNEYHNGPNTSVDDLIFYG